MTWHGYIAGQDIALQAGERAIIWNLLLGYGIEENSPQPARRMHSRTSPAGDKRIFEAAMDEASLAISAFRPALATALGLTPADIAVTTTQQTFFMLPTNIVTFKYSPDTTNRFRLSLFGGTSATWDESRFEVLAYLLANAAEWGDA